MTKSMTGIDWSYSTDFVDAMQFLRSVAPIGYWYTDWPSKKSWIQKIRGYDALEFRCNAVEAMRDHYKTMADAWKESVETQKALAGVWEGIAVEACNRSRAIINRRLKFSVGHNHIEIIIGNPVTVAENFNAETEDEDDGNTDTAYTICSPKDAYNWKTGAIKALENLCHENDYTGDFTAHLFAAMKKKYSEVFTK